MGGSGGSPPVAAPRSAGAKGSGGTLGLRESEPQILCLCGDLEAGGPHAAPCKSSARRRAAQPPGDKASLCRGSSCARTKVCSQQTPRGRPPRVRPPLKQHHQEPACAGLGTRQALMVLS